MRAFDPNKVPKPKDHALWENWRWPGAGAGERLSLESGTVPVDLEIGCGVGWHPVRYALEHPERHLIALERTHLKFAGFESRVRAHRARGLALDNLTAVHADAQNWIAHYVPAESLARLILLYPNPYPKRSQRNLRFYENPFIDWLWSRLMTGGEVWFATNIEDYAQGVRRDWTLRGGLELVEERRLVLGAPEVSARTHFEKKYLLRGEGCFDLRFRKSGDCS